MTCVVGEDGCRKRIEQPCSLGCDDGACTTCSTFESPTQSTARVALPAFYRRLVRIGDTVLASWDERDGNSLGDQRGLIAVDVSDPGEVTSLATLPTPDGGLGTIVDGDRLYGIGNGRLRVYDVADPTQPTALGSYTPGAAPRSLAVADGIVYVGTSVGLDIVDVQASPPALLSVIATSIPAQAIAISGARVVVGGGSALELVDVSDPFDPFVVTTRNLGRRIDTLTVDGTRMYVLATSSYNNAGIEHVQGYDITSTGIEPYGTALSGIFALERLALHGDRLVVSTWNAVGVIDVSGTTPVWTKYVYGPNGHIAHRVHDVVGSGDRLFAATDDGIASIDLTRAGDVFSRVEPGILGNAVMKGSLAYAARGHSGFEIYDMRDPHRPAVLASVPIYATSVALQGALAYVAANSETLQIYDVTSPYHPVLVGEVDLPSNDWLEELAVAGDRAYLRCGSYICIVDVSSPTAPSLIKKSSVIMDTHTSQSISTLFAMDGTKLFLPLPYQLSIVDLANPTAPQLLGQLPLQGYSSWQAFAVAGDKAYSASRCHHVYGAICLEVLDVSDPTQPKLIGSLKSDGRPTGTQVNRITVMGDLLVMSLGHGVTIVDVSDPTHPAFVSDHWTSGGLPSEGFVSDRFLTTHTPGSSGYPLPSEPARDEVVELCR
ncbi:MAG: LVIVD repeat-containing protein [Kofleriaceae bacterium]